MVFHREKMLLKSSLNEGIYALLTVNSKSVHQVIPSPYATCTIHCKEKAIVRCTS